MSNPIYSAYVPRQMIKVHVPSEFCGLSIFASDHFITSQEKLIAPGRSHYVESVSAVNLPSCQERHRKESLLWARKLLNTYPYAYVHKAPSFYSISSREWLVANFGTSLAFPTNMEWLVENINLDFQCFRLKQK